MAYIQVRTDPAAVARMRQNHVRAFERARLDVAGEAKRRAPVALYGPAPGELRASIGPDGPARLTAQGVEGRVGSPLRYAMQREKGGIIRPVRRKALSWIDYSTGTRFVVGPTIPRNFSKIDKATGQRVVFIRKPFVSQRPGGPRQGYQPWLEPAGRMFPQFFGDHIRGSSW
jgi:hypothetical protein